MKPHLIFFTEFCKLLGRLGDATGRGDTHGFLGIVRLIRNLCDQTTRSLTFRVIDNLEDSDEDEL